MSGYSDFTSDILGLKIKLDTSEIQRWTAMAGEQLPFATMLALNRTAKLVKDEIREEMGRVFDRPRPATLNSLLSFQATKRNLQARVWIKDKEDYDWGVPFINFIGPNIYGGQRHRKSHEKALIWGHIMQENMYAVPAKGVQLDQYGNISSGRIMQMMSALKLTERWLGHDSNITEASRRRHPNRAEYFTEGKPPVGIFTRLNGEKKAFMWFVKKPNYPKKRLDFFGVGRRVVDEHLIDEMVKAIEFALATARAR
jgi:hypothetical protein